MNRKAFFDSVRKTLFNNRLNKKQVDGLETLLDVWEASFAGETIERLAYCLATAKHETAHTMQPIAEYGGDARAERLYGPSGKNPSRAKRMGNINNGDGAKYKGRGYVQLTWKRNYRKAGKIVGDDLVGNPDLALRPDYAARILYEGCLDGWFTTKRLSDYINDTETDYFRARYVVNGLDSAKKIAGEAELFEDALKAAQEDAQPVPPPPDIPKPKPPKTPPANSHRGFWGWIKWFFGW